MRKNVNEVKLRIARLKQNPVENSKLIAKWERLLRRLEK